VGDKAGQGFNLLSIGLIDMYLNKDDEAERMIKDSLTLRREINDERAVSFSLVGLGQLAFKRGDWEQAQRCFAEAYEICLRLGIRGEAVTNLSLMSLVLLHMGRQEEARELSEEAVTALETVDVQQPYLVHFNHFRVLAALDDPAASGFLQRAYDELMTLADLITDPTRRASFLERVAENRAILDEMNSGRWQVRLRDAALS
jgi:tetratricopeptide (TPR) repeat protein